MDNNTLIKIKSQNFRQSSFEFENVKMYKVIFQRVGKMHYLLILTRKTRHRTSKGGEADDIIVVKRTTNFKENELSGFLGNGGDIESGAAIDLESLNDISLVTDKEFRDACNKGSRSSYKFTRCFLFMELLSKFSDLFLLFVLPLYDLLEFSRNVIIALLCIFIPIILLQIICDWGKLSEKYSKLCVDFAKLANSKEEKRIDKYRSLVAVYGGSLIHSDILADIEI